MERTITVDISEENENVYIAEDNSSGASYPVDFSKGKEKIIDDVKKAFETYLISYLNYEIKDEKENDYEM